MRWACYNGFQPASFVASIYSVPPNYPSVIMKNKLLSLFICLFGILILGCSSGKEETKTRTPDPIYTLIFLDKTQSVNVNKAYVAEKYRQAITDILGKNMVNKGDKMDVYFIHENTSKAKALSLTVRSEMEELEGVNATDKEAIETSFQLSLQKEKGVYLRQLLLKLNQQNTGSSNQSTDILASIPIIAKATESGSQVRVYYFSDMIESVKGANRRDFHLKPPTSEEQAETEAKADAKKFENYAIGSPDVMIVSPFEPTASTHEHSPIIAHYWQTLFQELGGVNIVEE